MTPAGELRQGREHDDRKLRPPSPRRPGMAKLPKERWEPGGKENASSDDRRERAPSCTPILLRGRKTNAPRGRRARRRQGMRTSSACRARRPSLPRRARRRRNVGASRARHSAKCPSRTSNIASVYIRVSVEYRMAKGDSATISAAEMPPRSGSTLQRIAMVRPHTYANGIMRTPKTPGKAQAVTSPSPNTRYQRAAAHRRAAERRRVGARPEYRPRAARDVRGQCFIEPEMHRRREAKNRGNDERNRYRNDDNTPTGLRRSMRRGGGDRLGRRELQRAFPASDTSVNVNRPSVEHARRP